MTKPILGYWDLRVLAEPIRYLLHYKNVQFEDKRYQRGDGTWEREKFSLGLDFPSLPYYIDGDVKLTQSITILRHLAKKFGLEGNCQERLRVWLAEQQISDFHMAFIHAVVKPDLESTNEYLKKVPGFFKMLEDFIGNRRYLIGDDVTYVDFMAYEFLDFNLLLSKNALDEFSILKAYFERFKNIPELQPYFHSTAYKKWPIFKPPAAWGSTGEMP